MDLTSMQLMIQDLPGALCHAAPIDGCKGQHPFGREGGWECWNLKRPCMLIPPPYCIGSQEQRGGELFIRWFSNKLVFKQYRKHGCRLAHAAKRSSSLENYAPDSLEVNVPSTSLTIPHAPARAGRMQVRSGPISSDS